ncbi:orotidine 5'-phosphate decarboxylase [Yoonia sp. SS1-5]|uniref:Orotidine 5'-phosphate decarboxylase n=1 Tax=Yoonia rhodophyticola TaxID=3137370 RepID=A0AAN0NL57_9RHOB
MNDVRLHNVHYNPQAGAFEARVDIDRGQTTFRYPCQVPGPMTMDMDQVCLSLTRQALRMSDTGANLRSRF